MQPGGTAAGHRLDVQALRGIAVLAVVAFHAGLPLRGGFLGVDVFFVVSGFVITGLILRESANGGFSYPRFLGRRFLRLAPALALVVVVTALLGLLLLAPIELPRVLGLTGLAAQVSGANLALPAITGDYFGTDADANPLLHTWSLGVEEQFYLFFGLAAAVVGALLHRRIRLGLTVLTVVVVAGSLAVALTGLSESLGWAAGFYGPLGRAWELGAGVLLALAASSLRVGQRTGGLLRAAGLVGIGLSLLLIEASSGIPGPVLLLPVLATVAVLAGGLADPGLLARQRWLVSVGDRSYALYLWHWPLLVVAVALPGPAPVLAGAAVLLAVRGRLVEHRPVRGPAAAPRGPRCRRLAADRGGGPGPADGAERRTARGASSAGLAARGSRGGAAADRPPVRGLRGLLPRPGAQAVSRRGLHRRRRTARSPGLPGGRQPGLDDGQRGA